MRQRVYNATFYVDNKEYYSTYPGVTPTLQKIYNPEGYNTYAISLGGYFTPYYFRKDHLGNNREVWCAANNTTVQRTQYYPSGLPWASNTGDNPGLQEKKYNGKEFVEMHGYDEYDSQARMYYPAILRTPTLDPLSEKYSNISPYAWCAGNPVNAVDLDGREMSDFEDKDGNKISHVEDGSNAVYQLKGTDQTNESFKFIGFNNQGGKNEVSVEGAITGAQDYVTNNYTKCNQSVNFVGRTYESAVNAQGKTVDNIGIVNKNSLAHGITNDLASKGTAETSVETAQASAAKGNLVVGANGGHVVTMTTKTFEVTRYNTSGSVIEKKQIVGGKTTNVNGSVRATNIGPNKSNSFQNPNYSGMIWYSLPAKSK